MAAVGSACLFVGLLTAVYAVGASLYGAHSGGRRWIDSSRYAMYALALLLVTAFALLEVAYLTSDLSFRIVTQSSSADTPAFYKVTGMWSTQEGSLLLWVLLLSIFSAAVLRATRRTMRETVPYATAVLGGIAVFFLSLSVFAESPFTTFAVPPAEGNGLNPLLRHPAMMIHPPMLYSGYVGFSIPFAFAIGALITRRTGADWIRATRRFALIAWTFLGFGIMLGALWSYSELGWGGYWAWDPVENASLMPWLIGTAFLHSVMVQEKRGMLKVWNVSLIIATFVLSLLGTFLVRSGILSSIHAFGASTLGTPFLAFIATVLVGSVVLVLVRLPSLRTEARLDSLLSRESIFVLNNLVLVSVCFVIFWGTFFPLISEAVTGTESSVGPPWFNQYVTPLALVLVLLAGIGPTIAWRRATPANLRRSFLVPIVAAAITLAALLVLTPAAESVPSLIMFTLTGFVLAVVGQELWRGVGARRVMAGESPPVALVRLVGRNRRRYGGYVVHAGIALLFLGVAASSAFVDQRDVRLRPGQTTEVGDYEVTYRAPTARFLDDRSGTGAPITFGAVLDVRHLNGGESFRLTPARNYYAASEGGGPMGAFGRFFQGESTTEVDVRWGVRRDIWMAVQPDLRALIQPIKEANRRFADLPGDAQALVLAAIVERYRSDSRPATFRTLVSPMIAWIWIGGGVMLLGALLALWPTAGARERRVSSVYAARLGRELSRA
jgi:cytochrome c-type biogenesis protein CcmF